MNKSTNTTSIYIALGIIVLASFLLKMYFLLQTPHIPGIDAGYYVWHARDTMNGDLYLDEPPIAFLLSALISLLVGGDVMLGVKLTIALISSAIAIPFYLITKQLTRQNSLALFAAFLGAFSVSNWWISVLFIKNITGLFFGLFVIYYFIKNLHNFNKKNLVLLVASIALMVASHFSSSAYIVIALFPTACCILTYFLIKKPLSPSTNKSTIFTCAFFIFVILLATALVLAWKPDIIGDDSIGPIGIQEDENGQSRVEPPIRYGYSVFSLLALLGLFVLWRQGDKRIFLLFMIWVATSFLLNQSQFVDSSWLFRFDLMSFLPLTILLVTGMNYFKKQKLVWGTMLIMIIYTMFSLFGIYEMYDSFEMKASSQEFLGFQEFYEKHPDAVMIADNPAVIYFLCGIGFEVENTIPKEVESKREYFIIHEQRRPTSGMPPPGRGEPSPPAHLPSEDQLPQGATEVAEIGRYTILSFKNQT